MNKPQLEEVKVLDFFDACRYVEQESGIKGWASKFEDDMMDRWEVSNGSYKHLYFRDNLERESEEMQLFCKTFNITAKDNILLYISW